MRVLMLSKACLVGAYQRKLEEIARFPDVDLVVVVPPSWNDSAGRVTLERSHTQGYELVVETVRLNGRYHLHYYPHLPRRLSQFQPQVVHIDEEPYNLATWLAMRQAKAIGARTLFFSWQNLHRRYPLPFSLLEKQVLQGVDYAIMGNRDAAQVWQAKGFRGPYRIIPQFGVDPDLYRPGPQRGNGGVFTIGCANRRLVPEKGEELVLRAAARLPGSWQIKLAGEGPARADLVKLAQELGLTDRVQFVGPIASGQMPGYLQQLDVLVLASRARPNWKEQFGRVLVEAMACETAVIGADSGEIPHVVGDAGLIFPENDVAALHAHLRLLLESPGMRHTLGQKGRQRVLAHFTQAQIAAQTVAVYRELGAG